MAITPIKPKYDSKHYKKHSVNSLLLLNMIFITGCQPPDPITEKPIIDHQPAVESPITINEDTVTMSPEHILSIKSSRYQPSLGLQGNIEAIKQARFKAKQALIVTQVLVEPDQWVEAGTPLFIVERQSATTETTDKTSANRADTEVKKDGTVTADTKTAAKAATTPSDSTSATTTAKADTELESTDSKQLQTKKSLTPKTAKAQLITITAPFMGRVDKLAIQAGQQVATDTLMLSLSHDNDLRFVATLPIQAKPQLSVGQTVNFTTPSLSDTFTGQVSKLTVNDTSNKLLVDVQVINTAANRGKLKLNMAVSGRVDYGQIEVGTIVPKSAIHDVDLSALAKAPYRPTMTLTANVWIIQQNQRLTRQPVEVIEYDPATDRYLIAGINNDSLICLAQLPLQSAGKKVIIS